jgi:hypothetical protein
MDGFNNVYNAKSQSKMDENWWYPHDLGNLHIYRSGSIRIIDRPEMFNHFGMIPPFLITSYSDVAVRSF